jgi:hypothetical protein
MSTEKKIQCTMDFFFFLFRIFLKHKTFI